MELLISQFLTGGRQILGDITLAISFVRASRIRIDIDYLTNFFPPVGRFHIARGAEVLLPLLPSLSLYLAPLRFN